MNTWVLLSLLLLVLLVPSPGTAQSREHATEAAASSIRAYSRLTIFDFVTVRVEARTAILTGKVTLQQKKEELARRIAVLDGIDRVRNEIDVLPSSTGDDALRTRTARAIYGNPAFWRYAALPHPPIHILVENGHITLVGVVATESERALAQSLATAQGERTVTNVLKTQVAAK